MSLVAEFAIPLTDVPLGDTLMDYPRIHVAAERAIPGPGSPDPSFWAWGNHAAEFLDACEQHPEISDIHRVESVEQGALFRTVASPHMEVIQATNALPITILTSEAITEEWCVTVRSTERDSLTSLHDQLVTCGFSVSLDRVCPFHSTMDPNQSALTTAQREALIAAFRHGYFANPRETSQAELGEQFDISHRAVSDRLRRGMRNLVKTSLVTPDEQSRIE